MPRGSSIHSTAHAGSEDTEVGERLFQLRPRPHELYRGLVPFSPRDPLMAPSAHGISDHLVLPNLQSPSRSTRPTKP